MLRVVVWDFKGEEGNSHEDGNQMFAGSCGDNGTQRRILIDRLC